MGNTDLGDEVAEALLAAARQDDALHHHRYRSPRGGGRSQSFFLKTTNLRRVLYTYWGVFYRYHKIVFRVARS